MPLALSPISLSSDAAGALASRPLQTIETTLARRLRNASRDGSKEIAQRPLIFALNLVRWEWLAPQRSAEHSG